MSDENKICSRDELIQDVLSHVKLIATVDFDKLEAEGVIEKVRGGGVLGKETLACP